MEKKILKTWPALPKRQAVVMEDGKLCLEIDRETEREKTSLLFYFGEYTKENYEVLEEVATLLFKTRRNGLSKRYRSEGRKSIPSRGNS